MTRISRVIHAVSWKYAIGELALIVIGVSLALAGSSWYTSKQKERDEVEYLESFLATLTTAKEEIGSMAEFNEALIAEMNTLLEYIEERKPYDDSWARPFAAPMVTLPFRLDSAVFESLRSRGLEVISSRPLRFNIISLFEQRREYLDGLNALMDQQQLELFDRYRSNPETGALMPVDFASLLEDEEFKYTVERRVFLTRRMRVEPYRAVQEEIEQLIGEIDAELGRLQ